MDIDTAIKNNRTNCIQRTAVKKHLQKNTTVNFFSLNILSSIFVLTSSMRPGTFSVSSSMSQVSTSSSSSRSPVYTNGSLFLKNTNDGNVRIPYSLAIDASSVVTKTIPVSSSSSSMFSKPSSMLSHSSPSSHLPPEQ